jgi:hypothetical protein
MLVGRRGYILWPGEASDSVNHRILLDKLEFYWIVWEFNLLIKSYLNERYQRVLIDNTIRSNTPTGKRLKVGFHKAPFLDLYLPFINDLPTIATKDAYIVLFVDDTSIIVTNSDTHFKILMNKTFIDINKCFKTNLWSLNFSTTHCFFLFLYRALSIKQRSTN